MAIRKSEIRKLRRELISRKARTWSRLNKSLVKSLNEVVQSWLRKATQYTGDVPDIPDIPEKFTRILNQTLREALAYGYWLNHVYLQELRAAYYKTKYRGKITLADKISSEDKIRASLEKLIDFGNASEWHDVIPEDSIKWLEGYTPSLAGNLYNSVLEKTRDVIRESMQEGSTLKERMKALREAAPELEAMSKNRIEAIARTEITRADTMGTLIVAKSNSDVIGFEFSAIMDDRVTDICASRHGLFMKIDDPRLAENTPPLHIQCRSMLLSCTIYDFPDGLNTSHEFDEIVASENRPEDIEEVKKVLEKREAEPEIHFNSYTFNVPDDIPVFTAPEELPEAKQRVEDIQEVKQVLENMKVEPVDIPSLIDSDFVGKNYCVENSEISTIEELREMAARGEMPIKIKGNREERARLFEEIDKLYERPLYVHNVDIQEYGSTVNIQYLDNYFAGISGDDRYPSGSKASASEREGVIKHRMYVDRAEMELRIHNMFAGFPTPEMQMQYQYKPLTEQEKAAVTVEAERLIFKVMKSPVSPSGRELINSYWTEDNTRIG